MDDDSLSPQDQTHLGVWFCDVGAACAVGWAGPGQGRAGDVKHVLGGSMRVVAVLKTQLGAGWHDPPGGGGGRQTSDVDRAGRQRRVTLEGMYTPAALTYLQ